MITLACRNVAEALPAGLRLLARKGWRADSRNGAVVVAPGSVTTVYSHPRERVLLDPARDANPFFHLMEAIWMLAGRNDVYWPEYFVRRMRDYSDDGQTLHGAYGYRWRQQFGRDQLEDVVDELRNDADSRRAVLQMWDPRTDPDRARRGGRDVPCNLSAVFGRDHEGMLSMTVFQRSGDAIWGVHGANAVHFSALQEYVAGSLALPVGSYTQVTVNYHAYTDVFESLVGKVKPGGASAPATSLGVTPENRSSWDREAKRLCDWNTGEWMVPFFRDVAAPMRDAYKCYRETRDLLGAAAHLECMPVCDWRLAAEQWLARRAERGL